jgi:two-component system chemotaxis response regulator CheY
VEQGHTVVGEAADGERALDMCGSLKPDIIFADINMPKLDGHGLAEQIRLKTPKVRVVIISALPTVANVQRALVGGAAGFIVKPFNAVKVIEAVNNAVKQAARPAATP